jgi:predicted flap endonuclease-1-like 5' DNA nuclease
MLLFNICTLPWWLPWLLLPLLGLLLGWLLWGKFKGMVADLEAELSKLNARIKGLEADLSECKAKRATLDSELTLIKGQLRESKAKLEAGGTAAIKAKIADADSSGSVKVKAADLSASGSSEALKFAGAGSGGAKRNIYAVLTADNLQVVEGIGPKMDEVLKKHGIHTWKELAASTPDSLRAILDKENPTQYRIIDPTTWPAQAKLANEGKWEELIELQKRLDTGRANVGDGLTDSKVEKLLIKLGALKKWKQDDLKAVEGIGPKIEGLLKDAGIKTWRALSQTSVERIQEILDAAGPRYKLADPGTWPKQAEMAADGRWDDLQEYQDFLQGGR